MISDDLLIYLLAMFIVLMINIIGYTKIPFVSFIGILATCILAIPTLEAFGEYYIIAIILLLVNAIIPTMASIGAIKGD